MSDKKKKKEVPKLRLWYSRRTAVKPDLKKKRDKNHCRRKESFYGGFFLWRNLKDWAGTRPAPTSFSN
ncbi:hypothetical protein ACFL35_05840 [Candidatus Riflebacteria bacterium]